MRRVVAAVLMLLPVACAKDRQRATSLETFRGTFHFGFESQRFKDCRGEDDWWVDDGSPAYRQLLTRLGIDSAIAAGEVDTTLAYPDLDAWLVFRGDTSPVGHYGTDRMWSREVRIDSLLSARRLPPDSFVTPGACLPDVEHRDGSPASQGPP